MQCLSGVCVLCCVCVCGLLSQEQVPTSWLSMDSIRRKDTRHAMLEWGVCVVLRVCVWALEPRTGADELAIDGQHPSKRHTSSSVCS
jgi:hypothetical protein